MTRAAMRPLGIPAVLALALVLLLLATAGTTTSAANAVPGSNASRFVTPIGPNSLKPAACAAITLTTLVIGVTGTSGNDLLLGTPLADSMRGRGGGDCVLGGGGNDAINGGPGTDVCLGGPGSDSFSSCETRIQ